MRGPGRERRPGVPRHRRLRAPTAATQQLSTASLSISACIRSTVASRCAIVASLSSTACCSLRCAAAARASVACPSRSSSGAPPGHRARARAARLERTDRRVHLHGASRDASGPVQSQTWRCDACRAAMLAALGRQPAAAEPSWRRRRRGERSAPPRSGLVHRTRSSLDEPSERPAGDADQAGTTGWKLESQ